MDGYQPMFGAPIDQLDFHVPRFREINGVDLDSEPVATRTPAGQIDHRVGVDTEGNFIRLGVCGDEGAMPAGLVPTRSPPLSTHTKLDSMDSSRSAVISS